MSNPSAAANPLLQHHELPPFSVIKTQDIEPAIRQILSENRQLLAGLLENDQGFDWNDLVVPLEAAGDRVDQAWAPVSHLNAVCNSEELRQAYTQSLALLTDYSTELSQNSQLYQAYEAIYH